MTDSRGGVDGTCCSQALQARGGVEVWRLTGKVGGMDWERKEWTQRTGTHSCWVAGTRGTLPMLGCHWAFLPACPLLQSCFTTKPQKQKSPWEICVQSPPETRQVLVLRKPIWYRQTVLPLTHFISLPVVLGKGCHSVDRECDPESPGQGCKSP